MGEEPNVKLGSSESCDPATDDALGSGSDGEAMGAAMEDGGWKKGSIVLDCLRASGLSYKGKSRVER